MVMKRISTITLPGNFDIDLMFDKGKLAYTFQYNNQNYGNAVKIESKKVSDIASACMVLFTNAMDTKSALEFKKELQ